MPFRAGRPCAQPGCTRIVRDGRYCDDHRRQNQQEQDAKRGTASQRGYGAQWRRVRKRFLRQHPLCAACGHLGFTTPATDVDHILPRALGGTDEESNLQALCHRHHSAKTMHELREGIGGSNL